MASTRKIFKVSDEDTVQYRGQKGDAQRLAKELKTDLVEVGGYGPKEAAELVEVQEVEFEMTRDGVAELVEQEVKKVPRS
jgi:hypothetical protein